MIFYERVTVLAKAADGKWKGTQRYPFLGICRNLLLIVESAAATVEVSTTGYALHGEIGGTGQPTELRLEGFPVSEVWLRSAAGGEIIQVWAWGD